MLLAALVLAVTSRALDPSVFGRFRTWPITAVQELEQPLRAMGLNDARRRDRRHARRRRGGAERRLGLDRRGRPGGTGSFVSDDGLILTNWHVAYEYIRQASLLEGEDFRQGRLRGEEPKGRAPGAELRGLADAARRGRERRGPGRLGRARPAETSHGTT